MTSLNPNLNFKSSHISIRDEVVLLSVLYYCICDFPRRCRSFNPLVMLSVAILSILCRCFKAVSLKHDIP